MDTDTAPPWGQYERLRPAQIEAIRTAAGIAYLPWGAIEWHSYHNPIGLDGMVAHAVCLALARETGGLVLPPVYAGTDTIKPFKGFKHSLEHAPETVRTLMSECLEQLADEGFRVIVLFSGHYGDGHLAVMRTAADAFARRHPDRRVWALSTGDPLRERHVGDHAARGETSLQMYIAPELVDLSLLPPDRQVTLDRDGVVGLDPRGATAAEGAELMQVIRDYCVPPIREMLREVAG